MTSSEPGPGFSRGSFMFLGVFAGFFVTIFAAIVVLILTDDPPAAAADTTAPATEAPVGDPANGEELYAATCVACHGADAGGIDGLGPGLVDNEFVDTSSDTELVAFLEVGRDAGDPDNESGVSMPPKGGNPALTEQDLADIVAYLRTLN